MVHAEDIAPIGVAPARFSLTLDDGEIAGWRWRNPEKPPLLFCHATGFCASVYKQVLSLLAGQYDIFAIDQRGHGRTTLPADPGRLRSWSTYAGDVTRFLNAHDRQGWTLAGHSMGAVVVTMAARGRADISNIALIEPVVIPEVLSLYARTPLWPFFRDAMPLVRGAAKRRASWPDRETVKTSYERKRLFRDWAPGVLDDYLEDGLVEVGDEDDDGVSLACTPAWEAATFGAQANDFWAALGAAPAPVRVLAAVHASSTVAPMFRRRLRRKVAHLEETAGVSHLAPMEKPDLAAAFIAG